MQSSFAALNRFLQGLQTSTLPNNNIARGLRSKQDRWAQATPTTMEVTSLNFETLFPRIIDAYLRCDFVAIDCELSGVRASDTNDMPLLTPLGGGASLEPLDPGMGRAEQDGETDQSSLLKDEAYRRLRSAARKYTVLQLGMTFSWVDDGKCTASGLCQCLTLWARENQAILC